MLFPLKAFEDPQRQRANAGGASTQSPNATSEFDVPT
jgi:hypothetical protein